MAQVNLWGGMLFATTAVVGGADRVLATQAEKQKSWEYSTWKISNQLDVIRGIGGEVESKIRRVFGTGRTGTVWQ